MCFYKLWFFYLADLRNGRTKQEELELEARYQLAQAHQKAKVEAEEHRQKNKLTKNSSIVHQLVSTKSQKACLSIGFLQRCASIPAERQS